MKITLMSGSFHSKSRSTAILKTVSVMFCDHEFEFPKLNALPFFCEDLNREKPKLVNDLISTIENCDGIIFCSPEYNHSIPAVLKNAIDWASRPAFNSPLKGKPVSIITQAVSPVGGARAQAHLKLVLDSTLSDIHMCHEMMIAGIDKIVNEDATISDAKVLDRLQRHVGDFLSILQRRRSLLGATP